MKSSSEGRWHSVVDKNSGRTYYYNDASKKTTWDKPIQLMSDEEADMAVQERRMRREFFDEMERNIFNKMAGAKASTSPRVDLMEEQMLIDERQRCMSTDSTDSQQQTQYRTRTISTIDSEMISYMRKQQLSAGTSAADGTAGISPLSRDASFMKLQAKDDTADTYSPRRSNSGQWGGLAAGLLDPGAEAKFAEACRQEDKQGGYLNGVSIMGTSPSDMSGDFDFLREVDYLTGRRKDVSKAAVVKAGLLEGMGTSNRNSTNSPRSFAGPRRPGLQRRNSTSTLFISSTMEQQDNDATIRCVAVVIRAHMRTAHKNMRLPSAKYDAFLDAAYRDEEEETEMEMGTSPHRAESKASGSTALPIPQSKLVFGERSIGRARSGTNTGMRTMTIPTVEEIEGFLLEIFNKSQLEGECIIMSLIYCERLVKQTKGHLSIRYDNWRSIVFACLVMASKVWDDLSMWNVDFSNVCSSFDLQRVNELEMAMLNILSYSIKVSASEYAKYYFHLRSMMARLGINRTRSTVPLDIASAKKLQLRTESLETNYPLGNSLSMPRQYRNRGTTTVGQAPNSLDRVSLNRAVSVEHSGNTCPKPRNVFLGIEDLMHSIHTNADGTDRTAEKLKASQKLASAGGLQQVAEAKR